jgi:hypothetical protein
VQDEVLQQLPGALSAKGKFLSIIWPLLSRTSADVHAEDSRKFCMLSGFLVSKRGSHRHRDGGR